MKNMLNKITIVAAGCLMLASLQGCWDCWDPCCPKTCKPKCETKCCAPKCEPCAPKCNPCKPTCAPKCDPCGM